MSGREGYNKYIELIQNGVPPYEAFNQAFPGGIKTKEQQLKEEAKQQQKGGLAQLGGLAAGALTLKAGANAISGEPILGSLGTKLSGLFGSEAPTTISVAPSLPAVPGVSAGSISTPVMPIPGAESAATTATGGAGSLGVYGPATIGAMMAANALGNMYGDLTESKTEGEQKRWAQLAQQGYAMPEFVKKRLAGEKNTDPTNVGERAVFFEKYGNDWANASENQKQAVTGLMEQRGLGREYRGTYDLRVDPNFEYQASKVLGRDEESAKKAERDAAAWNLGSRLKTKEGYGLGLSTGYKSLSGYGSPEADLRRYYEAQTSGRGRKYALGMNEQVPARYRAEFENKLALALGGK